MLTFGPLMLDLSVILGEIKMLMNVKRQVSSVKDTQHFLGLFINPATKYVVIFMFWLVNTDIFEFCYSLSI
jgi:hypothetical protein